MGMKSKAYVLEIDCHENQLLNKIELPFEIHSVSPSSTVELLIFNSSNNSLLFNINHELYQFILNGDKEVRKLPYEAYKFMNITFSEYSNKIYAITKRKIENDGENRTFFSLDTIEDGRIRQQFRSVKELDYLHVLPNNIICVSSIDYSKFPLRKRELHFLKEI